MDNDENYLNTPLQDAEYILYKSSAQVDNLVFTIATRICGMIKKFFIFLVGEMMPLYMC